MQKYRSVGLGNLWPTSVISPIKFYVNENRRKVIFLILLTVVRSGHVYLSHPVLLSKCYCKAKMK